MTTLNEFYTQLSFHDWYYNYSDDYRVWQNGDANYNKLRMIAKESPEHQKLFEEYSAYIFSNEPKPVLS